MVHRSDSGTLLLLKYRLHIYDDNDVRSGIVVISLVDVKYEHCY